MKSRTLCGPGGASIAAPPHRVSQWWRFQPLTEIVTQPLTPCVTAIARLDLSTSLRHAARLRLLLRSVKSSGLDDARAPFIDECYLLRSSLRRPKLSLRAPRPAWLSPHTVLGTGSPGARRWTSMSPPRTSFRHPFTTCAQGKAARPERILTRACGTRVDSRLDRMSLVEFCNLYNPRAQPSNRLIPGLSGRCGVPSFRQTGKSWQVLRPVRRIERRAKCPLAATSLHTLRL